MSSAVLGRDTAGAAGKIRIRMGLRRLAVAGVALAVLTGGAWFGYDYWTNGRFIESTDDSYVGGNVTSIAPHVGGFITEVAVADNQFVRAGQTLIRLDPRDYQAALDHAEAAVAAKSAALDGLRAQLVLQDYTIRQQEADVTAKSAEADYAAADAARYRTLAKTAAGSQQDAQRTTSLDQAARSAVLASAAGLQAARQRLTVLGAQIAEAEADVAQAKSDVETARLNLGYTDIRSPIDGYVGNRSAQVGAYVAPGGYLISVIPSTGLWVDANFKEDQLAAMASGRSASVVADVLPGHAFARACGEHGAWDRGGVQRDPAGECDGQFHQDRAAGAGAGGAGWRRCDAAVFATGAVDDRAGRYAGGWEAGVMIAAAPKPPSVLPFAVMCCGMFIALLDIQIVASSLQNIGGGLSAAQDEISWVQTAYLIAEIVVIPLSGWLTRVFSTRWLFTASAAGFTLTSMLCGLAWNIESMIVFRALQGLLGASMIPTVFTSSFHYFQGPRRVYSAAVVGTIASIAPTLGPVIGGWITDTANWHWLFYINLLPGAVITLLVPVLVRIDEPDLTLLRDADYIGIVLMAVGLGTLEYVLEEGTRWNWFSDDTIRTCAWIAGISLVLFVWRSLLVENPVVDLRALGNRNFTLGLHPFVRDRGGNFHDDLSDAAVSWVCARV